MSREDSLALLERAKVVHVATAADAPLLRPLHAVLLDGALAWHCSLRGEKDVMIGRPAQVAAHEMVAEIPSHFRDPENACPATSYYESILAEGVPEVVEDPALKAKVLQAIMEKYQPDGGHRPIRGDDAFYARALMGVRVLRMPVERIVGKSKLGQNRSGEELREILVRLWRRGGRADLAAIDRLRQANPDAPRPDFLAAPPGFLPLCDPGTARLPEALDLLEDRYWTTGEERGTQAAAHQQGGWAAMTDAADGRLAATGRILGDGLRAAWILDLVVREDLQGRGIGSALLALLLDHPLAREAARVGLRTRDAQPFYRRFGFVEGSDSEEMVRIRNHS